MQSAVQPPTTQALWAGRIISAIPVLMLLFSGTVKLMKLPSVVEGLAQYGFPATQISLIGILEVGCTLIYLIPRSAMLGAVLMTGFLGGAVTTNVRLSNPLFAIPLALGVLVWAGLYLRDPRLRLLLPLRTRVGEAQQ
ncbi:MAG TPA: DoxX family protein [Terriglobales bacterium]|nr:DoxX family protein [Terriglobales bacterium]